MTEIQKDQIEVDKQNIKWRLMENNLWLLFSNNNYQLPREKKEDDKKKLTTKEKKDQNSKFFYRVKKNESKGSIVYTKDGFGIIQEIKPDVSQVQIKVNNKINLYEKSELYFDIPLSVKYVSKANENESIIFITANSTVAEIIAKVQSSIDLDFVFSFDVYFNGMELKPSKDTIEKIGIIPNSKLIAYINFGKSFSVNRYSNTSSGWGYGGSTDGIAFTVNKAIQVTGFGIYTPNTDTSTLPGVGKFIYGNNSKGEPLFSRDFVVERNIENPEDKIWKFMFDKPISIKSGEQYSCVVEITSGTSHYGTSGKNTIQGDQDVTFTFTACSGSSNGTGIESGQVPEIYYFA